MPRPRNAVPTYRLHKPSGQAVVTLSGAGGGRHDVYLGPHGSPESLAEYERVIAESRASPAGAATAAGLPSPATGEGPRRADPTVCELCVLFLDHAVQYYRDQDGGPSESLVVIQLTIRLLRELHGQHSRRDFRPLA